MQKSELRLSQNPSGVVRKSYECKHLVCQIKIKTVRLGAGICKELGGIGENPAPQSDWPYLDALPVVRPQPSSKPIAQHIRLPH